MKKTTKILCSVFAIATLSNCNIAPLISPSYEELYSPTFVTDEDLAEHLAEGAVETVKTMEEISEHVSTPAP